MARRDDSPIWLLVERVSRVMERTEDSNGVSAEYRRAAVPSVENKRRDTDAGSERCGRPYGSVITR
jgi:hypothetical protein